MRGPERIVRRHCHVGADPRSLPVGLGHRIHRASGRNPHTEMLRHPAQAARMCTAAGRVAHDPPAPLGLDVVGEFLRAREGAVAGENVDRPAGAIVRAADRPGPELVPPVHRAPVESIDERIGRHEVAAHRSHHVGIATAVPAHVDDEGVGAGQEIHRRRERRVGLRGGEAEAPDLEVAHVARQPLHPLEAVVHPASEGIVLTPLRG